MVNNQEFLRVLFGEQEAPYVHVTGFAYDPSAIPKDRHLAAWAGGYFLNTPLRQGENQYFTISRFAADETGRARRRKALFLATYVIVLDDVKEKLSEEQALRLPLPTYKMATSRGSEQWGYRLTTPVTERHRVENLLDGLVASGLAPDGKDPGMKGVTRYVRLPDGSNTKADKLIFGVPYKTQIIEWHPERSSTIEELAAPFMVNLDAERRDTRVDGAAAVEGHPLLSLLGIKEERSAGRYDITCPWVHEHTGGADDGAAIFTNGDGSLGFKCHHGACQERTGAHLLVWAEEQQAGFRTHLAMWKASQALGMPMPAAPTPQVAGAVPPPPPPAAPAAPVAPAAPAAPAAAAPAAPAASNPMEAMLGTLASLHPTSTEAQTTATVLLGAIEELPVIAQIEWQDKVRDLMGWNKQELARIVRALKNERYTKGDAKQFYSEHIFVKELNQFYHGATRTFLSVDAFINANMHEDADARKGALQDGLVTKVDRLDYLPKAPAVFEENGIVYGNMYRGTGGLQPAQGDPTPWLEHWHHLGWGLYRDHMLQWMAFTLRYPEKKINHMMILGSREGCGKDFLLYPLLMAMGEDATVIDGDSLAETYTSYLNGTKYLHINEAELGDRHEAHALANKLKPIAAAPPDMLRVRELFTKPYYVRNLVNGTMTTNSKLPLKLKGSRRFYAVWSDLQTKGADGNTLPFWNEYWEAKWRWMKEEGGAAMCINYLMNLDLSTFKAGQPPPVTDFLREIQDESKPAVQRTVEAFTENAIGSFKADVVQLKDLLVTLKAGELVAPELMYSDAKFFSVPSVTKALTEMGAVQVRLRHGYDQRRVWVLRDHVRLLGMSHQDLIQEAERQWVDLKKQTELRAVK